MGGRIHTAYVPALGATLFCRNNSTEFHRTLPPKRLPSSRGQFRHGNSSSISGIPREFRNSSEVFTTSSEISENNNGEFLIFWRTPKSSVFRSCRGCHHFFSSSAELLPSPQIPVPPNPGIYGVFYTAKEIRRSQTLT